MKICLGSQNPVKFEALKIVSKEFFPEKTVKFYTFKADSKVPDQPRNLEETITGALNRAKHSFRSGKYTLGCGIESGIFRDPLSDSFFNTSVCVFFNGSEIFKGIGPAFMLPSDISDFLSNHDMELDDAVKKAGYTKNSRIGYSQGLIGILSKNRISRMEYTRPAVQMAFTSYNSSF
jgi:inosine/xanthosine triphosphatase